MKLDKLDEITFISKKIKIIDKEIESIKQFALLVSTKRVSSKISLIIDDLDLKEKETNKVEFDSDGSIIDSNKPKYSGLFGFISYSEEKPKNITEQILTNFTQESTILKVLDILIKERLEYREKLVNELKQFNLKL